MASYHQLSMYDKPYLSQTERNVAIQKLHCIIAHMLMLTMLHASIGLLHTGQTHYRCTLYRVMLVKQRLDNHF